MSAEQRVPNRSTVIKRNGTVVVAGALAQRPRISGHAWVFCNWLVGLKALGYDVLFIDRLEPDMLADRRLPPTKGQEWRWLRRVMDRVGLGRDVALLYDDGSRLIGMSRAELMARTKGAIAIFNVMGYLNDLDLVGTGPCRVFVDIDPGFPQFWKEQGLHDALVGHDAYVTVGLNVGAPGCEVPTCGIDWITTLPPVALSEWPAYELPPGAPRFTSVGTWRGPFGPINDGTHTYGLRVHELRKFATLPRCLPDVDLEVALDIDAADAADADLLGSGGWRLVDPLQVAGRMATYQSYIRGSSAELMVAKGMYVHSRSGWFSDRSACYLASGRPVVMQDTGFGSHLPTGDGLVSFTTAEEAATAIHEVSADLVRHAKAARELATEWFDASTVLRGLLARVGVA